MPDPVFDTSMGTMPGFPISIQGRGPYMLRDFPDGLPDFRGDREPDRVLHSPTLDLVLCR